MGKHDKKAYAIQSVENAFDLLELFHAREKELGLSEIGRELKLTKNYAFRLLYTLKTRNFLEHNQQTGSYRLGFKTLELRQSIVRRLNRFDCTRPMLEAMARECKETVCYSVLDNFDLVTIDRIDCHHRLRAVPQVGVPVPAYCTSAGKALLAALDDDVLEHYFAGRQLVQYTPNTITNSVQLRTHLKETALQGYAVAREEMNTGMSSVGTVIRDHTFKTIGAVSLVGPSERLGDERLTRVLIPLLLEVAAGISCKLGYWQADFVV